MFIGKIGMGIAKHRKSGTCERSPKYKMQTLLEARKLESAKAKKKPLPFKSVLEAFKK